MGLTQVNSEGIKDGEIKDADVNASAAIAGSKLAAATTSAAGSMSAADKTKLDGVATGANVGAALTGSTNNTITTVTGANALSGRNNLTFDGTTLKVNHTANATLNLTSTDGGPYNSYLRMGGNDTELRGSSGNVEIYTGDADGTSSTERVRIDSSGNVNINTTTAIGKLTLKGTNSSGSAAYGLTNAGKASQGIDISCTTVGDGNFGGAVSFGCGGNGRSGIAAYQDGSDDDKNGLVFLTHASTAGTDNAVERMRIHADGAITKPYHPCFASKGTSNWVSLTTGDGKQTLITSYELFDNGGNYNNSNYTFTAPVAGKYVFFVQMYFKFDSNAGYYSNFFTKNDAEPQEAHNLWGYGSTGLYQDQTQSATWMVELAANDYVKYQVECEGDDSDYYGGHCMFSGYLLA